MKTKLLVQVVLVFLLAVVASCGKRESAATGSTSPEPKSSPVRFHRAKQGEQMFRIRPLYTNTLRAAFEYERLPGGAVRFMATDHKEYCFSEPLEIQEARFSGVESAESDFSAKEKAMNGKLKFYMITSYLTAKGTRYQTFKYSIDQNGTVHFAHGNSRLAIPPPYIIEENIVAEGNHPKIPDYPPSPDRG
jgi:hypothetical protein